MNRKQFLRLAGTAAATLAWPELLRAGGPAPFRLGTWMGGKRSLAEWQQRLARLRLAGFDMVLVSARDDALEELGHVVELARDEGLEVHAWLTAMWSFAPLESHPEWYAVSRSGNSTAVKPPYVDYYRFLCPSRPEVQAWLRGRVQQLASVRGLTSVHLDYIRYPDVILPVALWPKYGLVQDRELPDFDFCYCDVCVAGFRALSGQDPRQLSEPAASEAWRRFRWDAITRLVSACYDEAHAAGKLLSAAVFPTPRIARALVRQDWVNWRIDALMPMIYHGFYDEPVEWIGRATREGVTALAGRTPLYAGLYLPDLPPERLAGAVRLALAGGAHGVVLFNEGGLTDAHLHQLVQLRAG